MMALLNRPPLGITTKRDAAATKENPERSLSFINEHLQDDYRIDVCVS